MRMRKGQSSFISFIAIAAVILAAGGTVAYVASSGTQDVSETVDQGDISDADQIKQSCLTEQSTICNTDRVAQRIATGQAPPGSWAKHVTVNQKSCWAHAKERNIFGPDGTQSIPQCTFAGDNAELVQCRKAIIAHCTSSDTATWEDTQHPGIPSQCYRDTLQDKLLNCSKYRAIAAEQPGDSDDDGDGDGDGNDNEGDTPDDFYLTIEDTTVPRDITNQDIIVPKVDVDTNADSLGIRIGDREAGLYDTGYHEDGEANDGLYANIIDISTETGENSAQLLYNYQGEQGTRDLGSISIQNDLSSPDLDATAAAFNSQEEHKTIRVDVDTGTEATIGLDISVWIEGNSEIKHETYYECSSQCTTVFTVENIFSDVTLTEGETAYAKVEIENTEVFPGYEGTTATASDVYQNNPVIVDTFLHSKNDNKVAKSASWRADLLGIAVAGATRAEIESVSLTSQGTKIADAFQGTGTSDGWIGFQVKNNDYATAAYSATVGPEDLASLGETTDINVRATFDDGSSFTHDLTRVETVEDTQAPQITDIQLGYLGENDQFKLLPPGDPAMAVTVIDDLSRDIEGDITIEQQGDDDKEAETSWDGKIDPADPVTIPVSLDDIDMDLTDPVSVTVEASDNSDNTDEKTTTKTLDKTIDGKLRELERNGDPANKINIIMLGDQFEYDSFKAEAETYLNHFFTAGDFADVHQPHRDLFNWYIVDTRETGQLCEDYSKENPSYICPDGLDFIETTIKGSDVFQNAAAGTLIVTKETVRPYAKEEGQHAHAVVSTTFEQDVAPPVKNTVAHELGHLVWGFTDEYSINSEGARLGEAGETVFFNWNRGDFTSENHPGSYTNVWTGDRVGGNVRLKCEAAINRKYDDTADPSWCREITSLNNKGYALHDSSVGKSLMWENDPIYYPTHTKRIEFLVERGVYE